MSDSQLSLTIEQQQLVLERWLQPPMGPSPRQRLRAELLQGPPGASEAMLALNIDTFMQAVVERVAADVRQGLYQPPQQPRRYALQRSGDVVRGCDSCHAAVPLTSVEGPSLTSLCQVCAETQLVQPGWNLAAALSASTNMILGAIRQGPQPRDEFYVVEVQGGTEVALHGPFATWEEQLAMARSIWSDDSTNPLEGDNLFRLHQVTGQLHLAVFLDGELD